MIVPRKWRVGITRSSAARTDAADQPASLRGRRDGDGHGRLYACPKRD